MRNKLLLIVGIVVILSGVLAITSLYTVQQTQQAIVLLFGNYKRTVENPGLHIKFPWETVVYFEKRVLNLDPPSELVILADQNRLVVDAFARYRITNPLEFYQTVRTEAGVRQRLGPITNAALRGVLGNQTLISVLSEARDDIMGRIREQVNQQAERFGIQLVDVRIGRADLPDETRQAVYDRMKSEREREAAEFRAQGFEQAQRIKATADREATVIAAEAKRESEILRGEGEGKRTEILNDAYGQDEGFFNFYRSMQAYEGSLADESTFMVLSPDSEFFDFFNQAQPKMPGSPPASSQ